jgi:ParB family chromosome partitioning protein
MSKRQEFNNLDLLTAFEVKSKTSELIELKNITTNSNQPRIFNKDKVEDLVDSISKLGLIEPIVLKKNGNKYIIVAGERRYRAAKELGWESIPAVITDASNEKCFEMALAENEKRKNLNPWEIGKAIQYLRQTKHKTAEEVSLLLGYSERYVKQLSSIARLDYKKVKELIQSGREASVKNLESLLKIKEGRGGETISPLKKKENIKIAISKLNFRQKNEFLKELKSLLDKYEISFK